MASAMTVSAAAPGDGERDFERFYAGHVADVRRVVRRYLWGSVVDDVVQETFAQAYRSGRHLDADAVRTYKLLVGIARNRSIDVLRRRMRGAEELGDDGRLVAIEAPACQADPEVVLLASRRRDGIAEAFDSMCDRQRRILFMHYVDGFRYEEIAQEEGITVDAVKAALARGRRSFKDLYATIADRDGLAVVLGGLVGRVQARLRALRDRVAASAESLAGGVTAASPAVANAFVAVVVAGSVSLAAGSTAAAAEGGPPDERQQVSAEAEDSDDGGDGWSLSESLDTLAPGDDAPEQGDASPGPGPSANGGGGQGSGGGGGGQAPEESGAPAKPGKQRASAEQEVDESPNDYSNAKSKAKAEAEADPEEKSVAGSLDAMADATVDIVEAGTETATSADASGTCPEETEPTTGDLTQDRPSSYVCPVVPG
jgi:RNA polymerase sigma-70 factor (ECF subfamily)